MHIKQGSWPLKFGLASCDFLMQNKTSKIFSIINNTPEMQQVTGAAIADFTVQS